VLLANIVDPVFTTADQISNPDISNPDISNATLWLAPGESAKITIRTLDLNIHDTFTFEPAEDVVPVAVSQAVNTEDEATPGAEPPLAFPSSPFLAFIQQPTAGSTNAPLGFVRVRVIDSTGAPLPGVGPVTLRVYHMPDAATPVRTLASVTNETGIATFDIGTFAVPGTYLMKASILIGEDEEFTWSDSFVLTDGVTFAVTNTNATGPGSLAQAILDANNNGPSRDTIAFNIPGAGPHVISPTSALPSIVQSTVIDATTQPGFAGAPIVFIDGGSAGTVDGLTIAAPVTEVRGLGITGYFAFAIRTTLTGAEALIRGNYIGVAFDGSAAPNGSGIELNTLDNVVGGTAVADRNVISGNTGFGVIVQNSDDVTGNRIVGNFIGTNAAGTAALPNGAGGVRLTAPTRVGGANAGEGNLISGNGGTGITLLNDDNESVIQGNRIGVNAAGDAALPNDGSGIFITDTEFSLIGGTVSGARNVISGNTGEGIFLLGDASATTIHGNYIGTNAAGTAALGNGGSGVVIQETFSTRLGGPTAAERNVISGNAQHGVVLVNAVGNRIEGNYIGTNAAGTADLGNEFIGVAVFLESRQNVIGSIGAGNVISGNDSDGITILAESNDNDVLGNLIGTNAAGTAAIGNGSLNEFLDFVGAGVSILGFNNRIGGSEAGAGNVISGNGTGISISGDAATANLIRGNLIGTSADGTADLGNRWGIFNSGAPSTLIGGSLPGEGNVISGSTIDGIAITLATATDVRVEGNRIGTSLDGMTAIPNTQNGISVRFGANGVAIGGGAGVETRNLISGNIGTGIRLETDGNVVEFNSIGPNASFGGGLGNGGTGVSITGANNRIDSNVIRFNSGTGITATGAGNGFSGNSISDNGALGIDLGGDGVTANDAPDVDGAQNFPVLTAAQSLGSSTRVVGSLESTPSTQFDIRFYQSPSCDASGNGEGQTQLGVLVQTTGPDGLLAFDTVFEVATVVGVAVTATARNMTTNATSEFSNCAIVDTPAPEPDAADGGQTLLLAGLTSGEDGTATRPLEWTNAQKTRSDPSLLLQPTPGVRDEPLLVALRLE
jgi:hypothetical protein